MNAKKAKKMHFCRPVCLMQVRLKEHEHVHLLFFSQYLSAYLQLYIDQHVYTVNNSFEMQC